jgi:TPR repeat protein
LINPKPTSPAQYLRGLVSDKGQGVPQDAVAAYKSLNLAAATHQNA